MVLCAIALGSNLEDPACNIQHAIGRIRQLGRITAISDFFTSPAWGYQDQPDFCNAALLIEIDIDARTLLTELQQIESSMGRKPTFRWGPRLIDLDILYHGDTQIDSPDLVLPHPLLHERAFVLKPLSQIDYRFIPALLALPQESRDQVRPIVRNQPHVIAMN